MAGGNYFFARFLFVIAKKYPTFAVETFRIQNIMGNYIRFDWMIKRLLRNKSNFVVLEGFLI